MPILKISIAVSILATSVLGAAGDTKTIPAIGAHQPILVVEKNVHPQNQMVVYTKEDPSGCFVASDADRNLPVFDFYWLMDGKSYKAVNPLIKSEIGKRFECRPSPSDRKTHFIVNMNDLKEVNSDIKEPKIDVYASSANGAREAEAQMNLGPSDGNMRIKLSSIYTEGRAFPPAVYSVTLKGEEIVDGKRTGKKITRKYDAKK